MIGAEADGTRTKTPSRFGGGYLLLDDLKLFEHVEVELVHRNLAAFCVPVAEKLPTEADADTGFEFVESRVVTNVIPLKTNQSIVTIDTTEANT